MTTKALILFSGGQDSTTCLAWALENFAEVHTVGFEYGQRHCAELEARPRILEAMRRLSVQWANALGSDRVLSIEVLKALGGNALTDRIAIEAPDGGLPTTFVPGRNLFFLTAAASLAWQLQIDDLVGGMCETDYSGYPDCRQDTITAVERSLQLGMQRPFRIHTPLMRMSKKETWELAERIGGHALVDLIVEETVTCYEGNRKRHHPWGYGCGACPACKLRLRGYEMFRPA